MSVEPFQPYSRGVGYSSISTSDFLITRHETHFKWLVSGAMQRKSTTHNIQQSLIKWTIRTGVLPLSQFNAEPAVSQFRCSNISPTILTFWGCPSYFTFSDDVTTVSLIVVWRVENTFRIRATLSAGYSETPNVKPTNSGRKNCRNRRLSEFCETSNIQISGNRNSWFLARQTVSWKGRVEVFIW